MSEHLNLLISTRNDHKTGEVRKILGDRFLVSDLSSAPEVGEVEETGATFEENAALKSMAASLVVEGWVIADDSGLEVDALGGAPGVYSARFAGPGCKDAENNALLLQKLEGVRGRDRSARFRCVIVLSRAGRKLAAFDGTVEGIIANAPRGDGGFGYDPLFIPEGHCTTFADLPPETKNQISHRARALEKLKAWRGWF
jgi:XTP/dITP diphosphohydrolase